MWFLVPYLATALALIGSYFLAKFHVLGWWLHVAGSIAWVAYALSLGQAHMALACAVYLPLEVYGIINWNRKKKND